MSLDERLRTELRETPLVTQAAARAQLPSVVRAGERGVRRRRRRIAIPSAAVVVAVVLALVLVARARTEASLDVIGPPPESLTTVTSSTVTSTTTAIGPDGTASSSSSTSVPSSSTSAPVPPSSTAAPTTAPAPTTPPSVPGSLPVDLTFTGAVAGHVTTATAAPQGIVFGPHNSPITTPVCTSPTDPPSSAAFGVQGTLAGRPFLLSYVVGDIHDVNSGMAEGIAILGHPALNYNDHVFYDATNVVVDADRKGGQIDADLLSDSSTVVGHVRGHFRCAS